MKKRVTADIIFFFFILFAPWWASVIFGLVCLFIFERYYEILVAGLALDVLYGVGASKNGGFPVIFTVSASFAFVASLYLKERIKFYK
ncbi:MAG: hypothetical protein Q8P86_03490 [bacterium]|nr:hypothetical protein [bacterium]